MGTVNKLLFVAFIGLPSVQAQVKIACIGNSITAGAYPKKLGDLLGTGYSVENDGVSGCTLMKNGDMPYWTKGKLSNALAFKPSIITIKLGTNDSKPQNWGAHKAEFESDLRALIDTLEKNIKPKPVIWLCLPVPAWPINGVKLAGIDGDTIFMKEIPIIKKVAADLKLNTIDLHTALLGMQAHFPDGVHPDAVGHDSIAANIYRALTKPVTSIFASLAPVFPELDLRDRDLRVGMPGSIGAHLQILDLMGRSLKVWGVSTKSPSRYTLAALSPGVYLVRKTP